MAKWVITLRKIEFSKILLCGDYLIFVVLLCLCAISDKDFTSITVAWAAQIGLSSMAYYWKSKCENRTKVPIKVIETLPENIRESINLTEVITSIIQAE